MRAGSLTSVMLLVVLLWSPACGQAVPKAAQLSAPEKQAMDALIARTESDRMAPLFSAATWTMLHCCSREAVTRAQPVLRTMEEYGEGNHTAIAAIGGAKGAVNAFRGLLGDPDPVMRGFAAMTLAAFDDRESKGEIAKLLKPHPAPAAAAVADAQFADMDRSRAAMALGLMGADEYAKEIAGMLRSDRPNVRSGAALGLGFMNARAHAKEIAVLLNDESDNARGSAERALAMLGAREYAKDIAALLTARGDPSVSETACFALARLRAAEQAREIAKLLGNRFRQGKACRALALMGEKRYAKQIAALLDASNPLSRCDALVSLGILNAREYEDAVAQHLEDKTAFVRPSAALALILMGSEKHAHAAAAHFKDKEKRWHLLSYHYFDPLVVDDLRELRKRADTHFERMRPALKR